jgi:exosome complex component RRP4
MSQFLVPGQPITQEQGFLRGHGSYYEKITANGTNGQMLVSSTAGQIQRINKLISVKPIKARYTGEVGDLVVGRISAVDSKRWKVDVLAQKDAALQLSSVNLPGGVQRMRTYEDQLSMRTLFTENDVISAEIQNIGSEGVIALHSRSLKYGKLENGQLISVPSILIKRVAQHYVTLPNIGIDVILGKNGYIWITRTIPEDWKAQEESKTNTSGSTMSGGAPLAETLQNLRLRHNRTPLLLDERLKVARVYNAIKILARNFLSISPDTIMKVFTKSIEMKLEPKDMIQNDHMTAIARCCVSD